MLNEIFVEDCIITMKRMPEHFIDLTVTSPPYDDLRDYHGYSFNAFEVACELNRVTKKGGVVVWVTNDSTIKGGESMTSFETALMFREAGFLLHDTMIWQKPHFSNPSSNRCHQVFEYMFVFSKGKPKTFNQIKDVPIKYGKPFGKSSLRLKNGDIKNGVVTNESSEFGGRSNVWLMNTVGQQNFGKKPHHPAMFPEKLAHDHIVMWSNESDIVYDPFLGGGTTVKMAKNLGRSYIASEISTEYVCLAQKYIDKL